MTIVDNIECLLIKWLEAQVAVSPTLINWKVMRSWDDSPSEGPELVVTCNAVDVIRDEDGIVRAGDIEWSISIEQPYDGQGLHALTEARGILEGILDDVRDAWSSRFGDCVVTHDAESEPMSDGMRYISTFSGNLFLNF